MSNDLSLKVMLEAVDRLTKPIRDMRKASGGLGDDITQIRDNLKNLERAQAQVGQFRELKKGTADTARKLQEAQQRTAELAQELRAADNPTKKLRQEFDRATRAVTKLKDQQGLETNELQRLRTELRSAGVSTSNLGQDQRALAGKIDVTNNQLREQTQRLDQARQKQRALAKAQRDYQRLTGIQANMAMGGATGMAAGSGVLYGMARSATVGVDYESSIARAGALANVDKTSAEFAALNQQAQELGASTVWSASQVSEGMGYLSMAGFKVNQTLEAMPGMLQLASAGNTDLATTADIASNILSGFREEARQMTRVGDVMAATITSSNTNMEMLGDTMKYVAPQAAAVGASVEEVAALSGLLGNVGIQGSMAGTALRALYSRMAAPPKMAADALAALSINTQDAAGNLRPMPELLQEIANKTRDMGNAQRAGLLKGIAGEEAGAALSELVNQAGNIEQYIERLRNSQGTMARISQTQNDTAKGDLAALRSAWEGLNITLTNTNNGPLRGLIQSATGVITKVREWALANPELAGGIIKVVAVGAAMVAGMGALALTIASVIGPFAMLRFGMAMVGIKGLGMVAVIGNVGGILKWVFALMRANPIGLLITAMVGLGMQAYKHWDEIKAILFSAESWPAKFMDIGKLIVGGLVDGIKSMAGGAWDAVKSVAGGMVDGAKNLLGIRSPSRVFMGIGGYVSEGLALGIKNKASMATRATGRLATALPAIVPAVAMSGPVGAATHAAGDTISITIHAGSGNASDIAREVQRVLDQRSAEKARMHRGRLYD